MDERWFLFGLYFIISLASFIMFRICRIKGVYNEKQNQLLCFIPIVNVMALIGTIVDFNVDRKYSREEIEPINYEMKYKMLIKTLINQDILTREEIKELEDSATLIDKLTI